MTHPLGFERGHDKIRCKQDRGGLGEKKPKTFHGVPRVVAGSNADHGQIVDRTGVRVTVWGHRRWAMHWIMEGRGFDRGLEWMAGSAQALSLAVAVQIHRQWKV